MRRSLASLAAVATALTAPLAVSAPQADAEAAVCSGKKCAFVSPNRTVCTIVVDSAACGWSDGDKWYAARLFPNGGLDPCLHLLDVPGRACDTYSPAGMPTLGYGETAVLGPYTCLVDAQSVTCTVNPSGRGFTINSAGIVPAAVAPPPPPPESPATTPPPVPPQTPLPPEGPPEVPQLPIDEGP